MFMWKLLDTLIQQEKILSWVLQLHHIVSGNSFAENRKKTWTHLFFCKCEVWVFSFPFSIRKMKMSLKSRRGMPLTCSVSKMSRRCSRPRLFKNWVMFMSRPETIREETSLYILYIWSNKNQINHLKKKKINTTDSLKIPNSDSF